jgi:hypothetical protein
MSLRVDHVLYAVGDLESGTARLEEELGVESVAGGEHPGWGTANRVVQLGPDYVEVIGVTDADAAAASGFGRMVRDAGDRLLGWAVATDDLDGVARRLGLEIERGTRRRPDGVRLAWRLAGVGEALAASGFLPFFIQWEGPAELHPGGDSSARPGIAYIELSGDEAQLREWFGGAELPVRVRAGSAGIVAVAIGDKVLV